MKTQTMQVGNVLFYDKLDSVSLEPAKTIIQRLKSETEFFDFVKEKFQNRAVVVVGVEVGDKKEAVHSAEAHVELALNVLRFYLNRLSPNNPIYYKMFMGIEGTTFTGTTMFIDVTDYSDFSTTSDRRGVMYSYHIEVDTYDQMMQLNLGQINRIICLAPKDRTPFERNLLTAINYYGYAMNEHIRRNAFIYFVTSLEALLLKRGEPKTVNLADRIDIILERAFNKKASLADRVRHYYDMRSDIVHDGIDNVTEDDLYKISNLVFLVIIKLLQNADKIYDKAALKKKIDALKQKPAEFKF